MPKTKPSVVAWIRLSPIPKCEAGHHNFRFKKRFRGKTHPLVWLRFQCRIRSCGAQYYIPEALYRDMTMREGV